MPDMQVDTQRLRISLVRLWLWAAGAHAILLGLCAAAVYLAGRSLDLTALLCMAILPFAYWVVYGVKFRLTVYPCGLGWVNRSGVDSYLPWADIERAERVNQFGLPVLAVWSATEGGPFPR